MEGLSFSYVDKNIKKLRNFLFSKNPIKLLFKASDGVAAINK